MTQFIFIRHGEPRYDEIEKRGYRGMGYDLGRLTDRGIMQAYARAKDSKLKGADLILSSPYTRALQTAAILSKELQIPLIVENDLHEWMPDMTHQFNTSLKGRYEEYIEQKGVPNPNQDWESFNHLKNRVDAVLDQYQNYQKVIVVCHGIVMSSQTHFDDLIEYCGVRILIRS